MVRDLKPHDGKEDHSEIVGGKYALEQKIK